MIKIIALDHIVLNTYDKFQDMLDFYCLRLGCQVEREVKEIKLTQLRAGHALIDLIDTGDALKSQQASVVLSPNLIHFCLTIEQKIDQALLTKLSKHGGKVSTINYNYGAQGFGDSVYIDDPCGNIVELKQHMPSIPTVIT